MPLVDANMRELSMTGFMSNRGRQNVASYLIHDLGEFILPFCPMTPSLIPYPDKTWLPTSLPSQTFFIAVPRCSSHHCARDTVC
jgi:hypothetical protein